MDMSQYLGVFIDEAREHLQNLNDKLLELEGKADDPELISSIFRSAHTLKGSSGQMGFKNMMELTHTMENVFDALRHAKIKVSANMIDVLFETLDLLESMIDTIEQGGDDKKDAGEIMKKLRALDGGSNGIKPDTAVRAGSGIDAAAAGQADKSNHPLIELAFDAYDNDVIQQARSLNLNIFQVSVTLRQDCVLKAARALMVSNALEVLGNIIKSVPSTEEIENEAFDRQFTFVIATDTSEEVVRDKVLDISEIERVDLLTVGIMQTEKNSNGGDRFQTDHEASKKDESGKDLSVRQSHQAAAKTIRVNLDRLDHLLNLFEEMIIDRSRLEKISSASNNLELKESVEVLKRISDQLQETILNLRMEPVEQVFNRFPRMVRSLSKELDKKVRLVISGAETELDRTVIDEIGDPLMHMIRNSMDHGIEHPDVREKIGKDQEGILSLRAYHSGNHVIIEIEDDGAGINREKVLLKAVEKGIVSKESVGQLSDKDVYHLLFESGFSTADKISDISGRGVGLDVVESKIHSLSGTVQVDSAPGKGTKFTVRLPLTLSIIHAMLIRTGAEIYAIPITSIVETALMRLVKIRSINSRQVMSFQDHIVPLLNLGDFLGIPCATGTLRRDSGEEVRSDSVVLVKSGEKLLGIITEKLLGYQDIVIKPLGKYFKYVKGFSGATILGDGKVALILDCRAFIEGQKKASLTENV